MVDSLAIYTQRGNGDVVPFPPTDLEIPLSYNEQAQIGSYTFTAGRMGAVNVQATLMYPVCLDNYWSGAEFVEFRGERYWIFTTPTSSKSNTDIRYKHELNFTSERIALDNTYFFDVVSPDAADVDQFVSNSTKFTFFGDIVEFVKRMNYSFQYSQLGYSVVIDEGVSSEAKLMSFEDKFFSDVLVEVFNVYELPYYFVGKTIHIGFTSNAITHKFRYGYDKELLSISKTNANYRIVNRCTGTGSSENIPFYYPNDTQKGTVLAIAGETNKGVLQDNILVSNQQLYQEKISINKPVTYEIGNKIISPSFWTKKTTTNASGQYLTREYPYSADKGVTYGYSRGTDTSAVISISNSGQQVGTKFLYNISFTIYAKFKIDVDSEISLKPSLSGWITTHSYFGGGIIGSWDLTSHGLNYIIHYNNKNVSSKSDPTPFNVSAGNVELALYFQNSFWSEPLRSDRRTAFLSSARLSLPVDVNQKYNHWVYEGRSIKLSDIGITINNATPQVGDYFTQQQDEASYYITSDKLMPPIYRESGGAERFYPAKNNTYISPETGEYYQFENEYTGNNPKEMIVSFDYIKPTIKNIKNAAGELIGEIVDIAFDDDDNDEFDDKQNKYEHEFFYIKLRRFDGDYGFNLFEQGIASNEMTISMTSGNCAACNFKIGVAEDEKVPNKFYNTVQVDNNGNLVAGDWDKKINNKNIIPSQQNTMTNEVWIAVEKDTDTFGTIMPSNQRNYKPKKGDSFVLINIDLPKAYILAAENELKEAIFKYMAANNSEKFNFSINFKRIFFAEYPEILAQLDENARLLIEYDGKEYTLYVSSYSYKVKDDEILPEISVDLSDTITVKKGSLQKSIDSVKADIMSSIGSIDFLKMGLKYFIRKDTDDSANGHIVFKDGIFVTRGTSDDVTDAVILQEENNSIYEENNAIQEDTPTAIDVPPVPADTTLGDLANVKQLVDEPAIEDMVLAKMAGTSEWTQMKMPSGGGGSTVDDKYASSITNKNMVTVPSFTDIEGKKLSELEGKSFSDIFDMLFFATVYPTFIAPSTTISTTWGSNNSTKVVGDAAPALSTFSHVFNRGAINITIDGKVTKQDNRAGAETSAVYTADGSSTFPTTFTWGTHTYKVVVNYAQGAQPKDSKGNNYGSPLPAGSVSANFVVNAGYNWYAGNDNPNQALASKGIVVTSTTTLENNFASEAIGRYFWRIPKKKNPVKIEYYDTNSSKWVDDSYGTNWIKTSTTVQNVDYWNIQNANPTQRGALKLRITLTNA